jgi:predicted glycosyltransferase
LIISAGGTMNREAAALGVPAATIYAGEWAAIDEQLVNEGRLRRINSREDVDSLPLERKPEANPRRAMDVRNEVIELILTSAR